MRIRWAYRTSQKCISSSHGHRIAGTEAQWNFRNNILFSDLFLLFFPRWLLIHQLFTLSTQTGDVISASSQWGSPGLTPCSVPFHEIPPLVNKSFITLCIISHWESTLSTSWPAAHFWLNGLRSWTKERASLGWTVITKRMRAARRTCIRLYCLPHRERWTDTLLTCVPLCRENSVKHRKMSQSFFVERNNKTSGTNIFSLFFFPNRNVFVRFVFLQWCYVLVWQLSPFSSCSLKAMYRKYFLSHFHWR